MGNCPGILNFFPRKGNSKDSTTGQPEETEDGGGESSSTMPAIGRKKECPEDLKAPIADLEEKLRSKPPDLTRQNATRHQAVLRFPYCQKTRQKTDIRQSLALQVARCFNRGCWFAYELGVLLEKDRTIPTGKQGSFQKVKPWLTDEGVDLAVRKGKSVLQDCGYDFEALKVTVPLGN
ncbi:hypothetical protein V8E54_008806 [Elaphomyces granulatus]